MTKHNVSDDILNFYYIYLLWVFIRFVCVHIPGIHVEVKDNFWKLLFSFHLWVLVIRFQHVECSHQAWQQVCWQWRHFTTTVIIFLNWCLFPPSSAPLLLLTYISIQQGKWRELYLAFTQINIFRIWNKKTNIPPKNIGLMCVYVLQRGWQHNSW